MASRLFSLALTVCVAGGARTASAQHSLSLEGTLGKGFLGASVFGDFELVKETTFLSVCYNGARSEGFALSHQFCAGVEQQLSPHWLGLGLVGIGLPSTNSVELSDRIVFRSINSSLQGSLAAAYDSAGFGDLEYGFDLGLGATSYRMVRELSVDGRAKRSPANLTSLRPTVGGALVAWLDTELGLRASYFLYTSNPLTAGRFTEAELRLIENKLAALAAAELLDRRPRDLSQLAAKLGEVDALTGFPSAPLQWELRPSLTHRFNRFVRGQISYTWDRYVPTQGNAHVFATRWTFRVAEPVRLALALAIQVDLPEESPPDTSGLTTAGVEYTF